LKKRGSAGGHVNEKAAYFNDYKNNEVAAFKMWLEPFCRLILLFSVASNTHHTQWRRHRFDDAN
jgi:hypothetical protein